MIEKTAGRIKPILKEVLKLMVSENGFDVNQFLESKHNSTL
jgi:hypothetical protein